MKTIIYFLFILISATYTAQCVSNVDLNTWSQKGPTGDGTWTVSGGGTSVYQSINGAPTFFVNPQDLINVEISGQFGVRAGVGDNDWMGFVIGFKTPLGTSDNYDFMLFDWNKEIESGKPHILCLSEVKGTYAQTKLWSKVPVAPGIVNKLQFSDVYPGWTHGTTYNFSCLYTSSRILIKINGVAVVDVSGCFEPGKFGFYNFSQGGVDYSNFSYRSVTDFSIANDSICFDNNLTQGNVDLDLFCYGNSVSNPYNVIRWEMGDGTTLMNSSTFSHSYTAPGVYNIELYTQDLAGCEDSLTKTITVLDPNISVGNDIDSCTNGTVNITAVTSSPNITSYLWNSGATINSITPNTTGTYSIEITDDAGCKAYDTMSLVIHEVPQASISYTSSCLNNQSIVTENSTISSGSITNWQWDFGDGNTFSNQNPTHSYANDGTYNIQLSVTSDNNCTNTQTISYSVYPLPINNAGADITLDCQTTTGVFTAPGSDSYSWDTPTGIINAPNVPVSYASTAGDYKLTTTSSDNCIVIDTAVLFIDTIHPIIDAGIDSIITCQNTILTLDGTGSSGNNFNYLWTTNSGSITSGNTTLSPNVSKDGIYYFTILNSSNFCSKIDSLLINIDTTHPASYAGIDSIVTCLIPEITLNGNGSSLGNFSYNWTSPTGTISSNSASLYPSITSGGTYYLAVTNNYNLCSSVSSVFINEDLSANVDILSSSILVDTISAEPPLSIDFSWVGDYGSINWDLGDNNFGTDSSFTHSYNLRGTYDVIITLLDENGCVAYDSLLVIVKPRDIIFPNVFTPNNDGENDIFSFRGEKIKEFTCSIFNRWGQEVYNWNTPVGGWDGRTIAGKESPTGEYFYILKAVDQYGKTIEKKGIIMLMR